MSADSGRRETIQRLMHRLRQWERPVPVSSGQARLFSTGLSAVDGLLPEGGLRRGTLIEWLHAGEGSGATSVALELAASCLRQSCGESGGAQSGSGGAGPLRGAVEPPLVVVIDGPGRFYPPAWARRGMSLQNVIVVHPQSVQESLWAWEQSLRTPGVLVSLCWLDQVSDRAFRRLQLAVDEGQGVGQLIRGDRWQSAASWADFRFRVSAVSGADSGRRCEARAGGQSEFQWAQQSRGRGLRRLEVELVYARGWCEHRSVEVSVPVEHRGEPPTDGGLTATA